MSAYDRLDLARKCYGAYVTGDRHVLEVLLSDDFTFSSPADVGIDKTTYFERCWPNSQLIGSFDFKRLIEAGDEVIVTYECTKKDGSRFRNTEILTFRVTNWHGRKSTLAGIFERLSKRCAR